MGVNEYLTGAPSGGELAFLLVLIGLAASGALVALLELRRTGRPLLVVKRTMRRPL